jgi:hypothetical protein
MGKHSVYKLIDGRTNEVKYVGKTSNGINLRRKAHISTRKENGSPLQKWLYEIYGAGLQYLQIVLVANAREARSLNKKEAFYIKRYSKQFKLLNQAIPGQPHNSGRKPITGGEKKVALTIFPKRKDILKCGGTEKAKEIALQAIQNAEE